MNYRQIKTYLILITFLICNDSISQNSQPNKGYSDHEISNTLKIFYTSYFNLQNEIDTQVHKIDSLLERHCTQEFLKFYRTIQGPDELDWDPFLNANYIEPEFLRTLKIYKDNVKWDLWYVSYIKNNSEKTTIELIIIKEYGTYKINSLPQLSRHIQEVRSHKN